MLDVLSTYHPLKYIHLNVPINVLKVGPKYSLCKYAINYRRLVYCWAELHYDLGVSFIFGM